MKLVQIVFALQLLSGASAGLLDKVFRLGSSSHETKDALEVKSPEDHRQLWGEDSCPGNSEPHWFCKTLLGQYGRAKQDRSCYDNHYDCTCMYGYTKIQERCEVRECHTDKHAFCEWVFGVGGIPKSGRYCYDTRSDCECDENNDYHLINGQCSQCANEPTWFCKGLLGDNAIPRSNRQCYDTADDCMCMDNYFLIDGNCDTYCPEGQEPVHGVCQDVPEVCESNGWDFCTDLCGPHAMPKNENESCYKYMDQCKCIPGSHGVDGTCVMDPSGYGDPHFITFHGHDFEFHGECDLVLVHAPTMDMDIHVRTTIRYDYSFISQAAIRMGKHTFEVASWGEYQLDGIQTSDLPAFIDGHPITVEVLNPISKKYKFTIHLEDDKAIRIVSFKDYVSVKLLGATEADYQDASGLMGHFLSGDMVARDGRTTMDDHPNEFGMEWQVRPDQDGQLFAEAREPQYPQDRCRMPSASAIHARKLGEALINQEIAENACAGVSLPAHCVQDVLKSQDLDMAEIYQE